MGKQENANKKNGCGCLTIIMIVLVMLIVIGISLIAFVMITDNEKGDSGSEKTVSLNEEESTGDMMIDNEEGSNQPVEENNTNMTIGQKNALERAKDYLNYTSFSEKGLADQLKFDEFPDEDITYAVSNCGADWSEQAVKKAKEYLDYSAFSKKELIKQLEFDGFTHEQAVYGVEKNGY